MQLSLSTATPSLGGVLPKLGTLKIGYFTPRIDYDRFNDQSRSNALCLMDSPASSALRMDTCSKRSMSMSFRARSSLNPKKISEEEEDYSEAERTVNMLGTKTEASMSSSSFAIPRRSTIDADVSAFIAGRLSSSNQVRSLLRANRIK